ENRNHFPYTEVNIFLPTTTFGDDENILFTDDEYRQSIYFAMLNALYLTLGLMALYPYLKKYD
ncbi:hypothetical protein SARC_15579, partial [Sphaeroforma arctica JP610]